MRSIINSAEKAKAMYAKAWKKYKIRRSSVTAVNGRIVCSRNRWWPRPWGRDWFSVRIYGDRHKQQTHLTVCTDWHDVNNHGHERGKPRKGINLRKKQISPRLTH